MIALAKSLNIKKEKNMEIDKGNTPNVRTRERVASSKIYSKYINVKFIVK